jgi:hypothetical protein
MYVRENVIITRTLEGDREQASVAQILLRDSAVTVEPLQSYLISNTQDERGPLKNRFTRLMKLKSWPITGAAGLEKLSEKLYLFQRPPCFEYRSITEYEGFHLLCVSKVVEFENKIFVQEGWVTPDDPSDTDVSETELNIRSERT